MEQEKHSLTLISASSEMSGDLISAGEIQIDGKVTGNIKCRKLIVGEAGQIQGTVVTEECVVHGTIIGQVSGEGVTLTHSARVDGEVYYGSLAIETGGLLDGKCQRLDERDTGPKLVTEQVNALPA